MGYQKLTPIIAAGSTEPRYLGDRFADTVNVRDFGAKGDGATDDKAALQAAFDAAHIAGKKIFVPSGTYVCSGALSVDMQTGEKFDLYSDNATLKLVCDSPINGFISIRPAYASNEVNIENIVVDGNNKANIGIEVSNSEATKPSVSLVDVTVQNIKKTSIDNECDGIYVIGEFENVRIINPVVKNIVMAENTGDTGVTGVFGISVMRVNATGAAADNTYIENPYIENIYCEDATYVDDQDGIRCFSDYGAQSIVADTFSVVGGYFKGIRGRAIKGQTQNCFIDGCTIVYGNDLQSYDGKLGNKSSVDMQVGCGNISNITFICDSIVPESLIGMTLKSSQSMVNAQGNINNIRAIISDITLESEDYLYAIRCSNRLQVAGNEKTLNISNVTIDSNVSFYSLVKLYTAYSSEGSTNQQTNVNICNVSLPVSDYLVDVVNAGYANVDIVNARNISSGTPSLFSVASNKQIVNGLSCSGFSGVQNILNSKDGLVINRNGYSYNGLTYTPSANDALVLSVASSAAAMRVLGDGNKHAIVYIGSQNKPNRAILGTGDSGDNSYFYVGLDGTTKLALTAAALYPFATDVLTLGLASRVWSNIYATTGPWAGSDRRIKDNIEDISDDLVNAWGDVEFKVFQMKDAVAKKGSKARLHVGIIAQDIAEALQSKGLDAGRYGFFGYDEWQDVYEESTVVDKKAVLDGKGNVVEPEQTHIERRLVQSAGNKYSVRYEEALVLECAYLRSRISKMQEQIDRLAASVEQLTSQQNN